MSEKYSICVLDEKLPARHYLDFMDPTKLLNRNNFKHLLSNETKWDDERPLLALCKELYGQDHELSGFTHHVLFFNYADENIFLPDIVVFDWDVGDFGGEVTDSAKNLLDLLSNFHCLVAIYSADDNQEAIQKVLEQPDFKEFKERVFLQTKGEKDAAKKLIEEIEKRRTDNFSFKLGRELKTSFARATNQVLAKIGKLSFEQFVTAFGVTDTTGYKIDKIDFISLFLEKVQSELLEDDFYSFPLKSSHAAIEDFKLLRKLWHFRLYHKPTDNLARKGDIIKRKSDGQYFLVLTSDCHLKNFWKKNLGSLTLIGIHENSNSSASKRIKKYYKPNSYNISSLTNPNGITQFTILPALEKDGDDYKDFILIPKELTSILVEMPEKDIDGNDFNKNSPFYYDYLNNDYHFSDRLRITEPFISPLTEFIIRQVADIGVPDFNQLSKAITAEIKKIADEEE